MADVDPSENRAAALADLRATARAGDAAGAADALVRLIQAEPGRWRHILLLESVIPDASAVDWQDRLAFFMRVLKQALDSQAFGVVELRDTLSTILALLDVGQRLEVITRQLVKAPFFNGSKATQIYRLAIWLESQGALLQGAVDKVAKKGVNYDPIAAMQTSVSDPKTGESVAPVRSWENMVDAAELVLKYLLYRQREVPFGNIDFRESPYDAADFVEIVRLSIAWQELHGIWADVKFNGWLPHVQDNVTAYLPPDEEDMHRRFVSIVRDDRLKSQEMLRYVTEGEPFSNDDWEIRKMARRVKVPPPGAVWNCAVDGKRLRMAVQRTVLLRVVQFYVEHRHYRALVDSLKTGMGTAAVTWEEWLSVRNALAVTAEVFGQAVLNQVDDEHERRERPVVPVRLPDLADLIAVATGLGTNRCRAALELILKQAYLSAA
jgi:hypothetical protein